MSALGMWDRQSVRKLGVFLVAAAALFSASMIASAEPDAAARALFERGDYRDAAATASAAGGAENEALAARALNALAYLQRDDIASRRTALEALEHAERAIADNPGLVDGHLESAIARAERAKRMSPLRIFLGDHQRRARRRFDLALAMQPDNAWALANSALWHLTVSRRGGVGRFGADPTAGRERCAAAQAADPEALVIAYRCGLQLLAWDDEAWRLEAIEAVSAAATGEAASAFERAVQIRARALLTAIDDGPATERAFIDAHP
ncbi:MAG: hypothetical protein AAGC77_10740 [Pseudomonadota bacterium]